MSIRYMRDILETSNNIVCLQGRGAAAEMGIDFYDEDFVFAIEEKYGLSPDEIFSSTFYHNRPAVFYKFYREEMLKKRGLPGVVNKTLKKMEDDGRLQAIVTRGMFNHSKSAGCKNVIQLYGHIDNNNCPHCGKIFPGSYIMEHTPLPMCDVCGTLLHPGTTLAGEMLDTQKLTEAAEIISTADTLLVIGCNLASRLGSMSRYFEGDKICLINNKEHYTDRKADCVCIGESMADIIQQVYPGKPV